MNTSIFAVLKLLADGRFHSGEMIARQLGCSRTSVWQAIRCIEEELGLPVFSVRGQGYRLAETLEMLDVASIRKELTVHAAERLTIITAESVDSTNTRLMQCTRLEGMHGLMLAAELQTDGRGRQGRKWVMALARGLTFSLLWRFDRGLSGLAGLSLAVGVALARVLRALGVPVQLKWPNDLVLSQQKLAGILIEVSGEVNQPATVVIGIGLNLKRPISADFSAAGLYEHGVNMSRNTLLAHLLNTLTDVLEVFNQYGFGPFCEEWMTLSSHQNEWVKLYFPHGETVEGIARGVGPSGALLLETQCGVQAYHIGEVSLRSKE